MNLPVDLGGGCACRTIRYKLTNSPLIVHACHCRDCQRLTGGPFVINIWIESQFVEASPVMPNGTSNAVTFGIVPTLSSISPASKPAGLSTSVTLTGTSLTAAIPGNALTQPQMTAHGQQWFSSVVSPLQSATASLTTPVVIWSANDIEERLRRNRATQA